MKKVLVSTVVTTPHRNLFTFNGVDRPQSQNQPGSSRSKGRFPTPFCWFQGLADVPTLKLGASPSSLQSDQMSDFFRKLFPLGRTRKYNCKQLGKLVTTRERKAFSRDKSEGEPDGVLESDRWLSVYLPLVLVKNLVG